MHPNIDISSLTDEQVADFLASPMSQAEIDRLAILEAEMRQAFKEEVIFALKQGEALHELKEDPSLLWQRDDMFRTKKGGWVADKKRTWDAYCKAQLQMTGKEADELIARWLHHRRAVELQALIDG